MALLCCKVENLVVGTPCGTMDQVRDQRVQNLQTCNIIENLYTFWKIWWAHDGPGERSACAQSVWEHRSMQLMQKHGIDTARRGSLRRPALFVLLREHPMHVWNDCVDGPSSHHHMLLCAVLVC